MIQHADSAADKLALQMLHYCSTKPLTKSEYAAAHHPCYSIIVIRLNFEPSHSPKRSLNYTISRITGYFVTQITSSLLHEMHSCQIFIRLSLLMTVMHLCSACFSLLLPSPD